MTDNMPNLEGLKLPSRDVSLSPDNKFVRTVKLIGGGTVALSGLAACGGGTVTATPTEALGTVSPSETSPATQTSTPEAIGGNLSPEQMSQDWYKNASDQSEAIHESLIQQGVVFADSENIHEGVIFDLVEDGTNGEAVGVVYETASTENGSNVIVRMWFKDGFTMTNEGDPSYELLPVTNPGVESIPGVFPGDMIVQRQKINPGERTPENTFVPVDPNKHDGKQYMSLKELMDAPTTTPTETATPALPEGTVVVEQFGDKKVVVEVDPNAPYTVTSPESNRFLFDNNRDVVAKVLNEYPQDSEVVIRFGVYEVNDRNGVWGVNTAQDVANADGWLNLINKKVYLKPITENGKTVLLISIDANSHVMQGDFGEKELGLYAFEAIFKYLQLVKNNMTITQDYGAKTLLTPEGADRNGMGIDLSGVFAQSAGSSSPDFIATPK